MTPDTVVQIGQHAMQVTALLAGPLLISVLVVGLIVGMFQAVTQINEMTLSFIPKLMVLALMLVLAGSQMLTTITDFTKYIFEQVPALVG